VRKGTKERGVARSSSPPGQRKKKKRGALLFSMGRKKAAGQAVNPFIGLKREREEDKNKGDGATTLKGEKKSVPSSRPMAEEGGGGVE